MSNNSGTLIDESISVGLNRFLSFILLRGELDKKFCAQDLITNRGEVEHASLKEGMKSTHKDQTDERETRPLTLKVNTSPGKRGADPFEK